VFLLPYSEDPVILSSFVWIWVAACNGQTDGQTELPWLIQRSALQAMQPLCKNGCLYSNLVDTSGCQICISCGANSGFFACKEMQSISHAINNHPEKVGFNSAMSELLTGTAATNYLYVYQRHKSKNCGEFACL